MRSTAKMYTRYSGIRCAIKDETEKQLDHKPDFNKFIPNLAGDMLKVVSHGDNQLQTCQLVPCSLKNAAV